MPYIGQSPYQVAFLTDTFSGNSSTTAFTMSVAPANTSSVLVAISGVLQDPSTYSVSGTTLTFSAAPPTGTGNISARYLGIPASGVVTTAYRTVTEFTATAGQTTFTPPSYTVGFISVYRNGVMLGTADYTATNGTTVVLASGATSGDLVTVESFLVSSVLNAIPATAGSVGSTYLAGGAVTQAKLATGVAGTGPAFSAYQSTGQSYSSGYNKVALQTEEWDTANCFDSTTNYRFTPNVAGYYQFNFSALIPSGSRTGEVQVFLYKNGTAIKSTSNFIVSQSIIVGGSAMAYANGTTDYFEFYLYVATANTASASQIYTYFQGFLARSA